MSLKNLKYKILAMVASATLIFGIGASTVSASAEEITETPYTATETAPETPDEEIVEETPEETEAPKIEANLAGLTYEEFLSLIEKIAAEAGHEELWAETIASVKKAISDKQLTATTIVLMIVCAVMAIKILADWAEKRKQRKHIETEKETNESVKTQVAALNELIDEEEKLAVAANATTEKERLLANAGLEQNAALRCLFRGVQVNAEARTEGLRHLNNSDDNFEKAKK